MNKIEALEILKTAATHTSDLKLFDALTVAIAAVEREAQYTFTHEGVEYSRLSDRGRQVWDSINSDKNK